jgi:hypothetical protein
MSQQPIASGSNGAGSLNNKLLWWIVGGLLTPFILTAFNTFFMDSKRITALETMFQMVDRRLKKIDGKLEKLLDRPRKE